MSLLTGQKLGMVSTITGYLFGSRGWRVREKRNSFTSSSTWNDSISRVHFVSSTDRIKGPGKSPFSSESLIKLKLVKTRPSI
jgi:hypothetical protein